MIIGVVFLRYDGTAGITGAFGIADTVELEFTAQQTAATWAAAAPDWLLPAVILLGALTVAWRRRHGNSQNDDPASTPKHEKIDEDMRSR